jgi:hypothetical protein
MGLDDKLLPYETKTINDVTLEKLQNISTFIPLPRVRSQSVVPGNLSDRNKFEHGELSTHSTHLYWYVYIRVIMTFWNEPWYINNSEYFGDV